MSNVILTVGGNTAPLSQAINRAVNRNWNLGTLNVQGFTQPLGRVTGQASEFAKSLEAANARVVAFGASAGAIAAVKISFDKLISSTIEVEKSLADINSILDLSAGSLAKFSSDLFVIASKTGVSFKDAAIAATEFSRQGLSAEETIKRTSAALTLARLSGVGFEAAVTDITAALNSFNKEALSAEDIVNRMAAVDARFAVSAADLAEGLKRVGSTASDANVSFNQMLALITSVQQSTARGGAVIGNAFKTIFTRAGRPETLQQLEQLGVATRNAAGEIKPMTEILKDLADKYDRLGPSQKSATAEMLGGVYQINILKAAMRDLGQGVSVYDNALKAASSSSDEANQRLEKLNQTISGKLQQTFNSFTEAASKVGTITLSPVIKGGLDFAQWGAKDITKNIDAEGIGGEIFRGILKGMGNVIAGPGVQLITFSLLKLLQKLATFTASASAEFFEYNSAARQAGVLQQQANTFLSKNPDILKQMLSGTLSINDVEKIIIQDIKVQNTLLREQSRLAASIALNLQAAGVRVSTVKPTTFAKGYVPNFNTFKTEEHQAKSFGATAGVRAHMSKGTIAGQRFVMNNQETEIPNFGRNGDSAVIPHYASGNLVKWKNPVTRIPTGSLMPGSILVGSAPMGQISEFADRNDLIAQLKAVAGRNLSSGEERFIRSPTTSDFKLNQLKDKNILTRFLNSESKGGFAGFANGHVPNFANYVLDRDYLDQRAKTTGMDADKLYDAIIAKAIKSGNFRELITGAAGVGKSTYALSRGDKLIDDPAMLTDKDNLTAIRAIVNPSAKKNAEMFGAAEKLTHISASHSLIEKMRGIRKQGGAAGTAFGRTSRTRGATSGLAMEAELKDLYGDKLSVYERGDDFSLKQREAQSAIDLGGISLIPGAFAPFTEGHARLESIATKKRVFGVAKGENRQYDSGLSVSEKMKIISRRYPEAMTFDMSGYGATGNYFEHGGQAYKYDPTKSEAVLGADRLSGPTSSVSRFTSRGFSIRGDETRTTSGTSVREAIAKGDLDYLKSNLSPSVYNDIVSNLPLLQKRASLIAGRQAKWQGRTAERQAEVDAFVAIHGDRKSKKDAPGITEARYAIKDRLAESKEKSKGVPSSSVWKRMGLTMNFAAGGFVPNFANDITNQLRSGDLSVLDSITDARTLTNAYNQVSDPAVREAIAARKIKVYDDRNAKVQATRAEKMQDPLTGDTYGRRFSPSQVGYYIKNKSSRAYRMARSDKGRRYVHPTDEIRLTDFIQIAGPELYGADGKNTWGSGYEQHILQNSKSLGLAGFRSASAAGIAFSMGENSSVDGVTPNSMVEIKGGSDYSIEYGTKHSVKEKFSRAVLENFPDAIAGAGGFNRSNGFTENPNDVINIKGILVYNPAARKHLKKTQKMAAGFIPNFVQKRKMAGSSWWKSQMEKSAISITENEEFGETNFKSAYGSGTLARTRHGMDLSNVEIDPAHRGRGYSGDLYNAMFSHAKSKGINSLSGILLPQGGKFPFATLMNRVKYGKATQVSLLDGRTVTVKTKEDVLNLAKSIQASDIESGLDAKTMFAGGFIPNFNAVSDAVKREHAAGIPMHAIRVDRHPSLVSPHNPSGTGVWNTVQETGLSDGMNKARSAGISIKTKGMAKGHVPNFVDDMGSGSGVGASMALGALAFILPQLKLFGKALKEAEKNVEDSSKAYARAKSAYVGAKSALTPAQLADQQSMSRLKRGIFKGEAEKEKIEATMRATPVTAANAPILNQLSMDYQRVQAGISAKSNRLEALQSNDPLASKKQDVMEARGKSITSQKVLKAETAKSEAREKTQARAMGASIVASQVSGVIPQTGPVSKAIAETVDGFSMAAQAMSVIPGPAGLAAAGLTLAYQGGLAIHRMSDEAPAAKIELETMQKNLEHSSSALSEYSQTLGALSSAYSDSTVSTKTIADMQLKVSKSLANVAPEHRSRLAAASSPEEKQRIAGEIQEEAKKKVARKEKDVKLMEMMDKRRERDSISNAIASPILGLMSESGIKGSSAFDETSIVGNLFSTKKSREEQQKKETASKEEFATDAVDNMSSEQMQKASMILSKQKMIGKSGFTTDESKIQALVKTGAINQTQASAMANDPQAIKLLEAQLTKTRAIDFATMKLAKTRSDDLMNIKQINDTLAIAEGKHKVSLYKIDDKINRSVGNIAQAAELKDKAASHGRDKSLSIAGDSVEMAGMRYGSGTKMRLQSELKRQQILAASQNEAEARATQGKNDASKLIMSNILSKSDSSYRNEEGKTVTNENSLRAKTQTAELLAQTQKETEGKNTSPEEFFKLFSSKVEGFAAKTDDEKKIKTEMQKGLNDKDLVKSIAELNDTNVRAATNAEASVRNQIDLEKQALKGQMMILDEQRKGRLFGNLPTTKEEERQLTRQLRKDKRGYERGDQYATTRYAKSMTDMFGDTLPQEVVGKMQTDVAGASAKNRRKMFGVVSSGSGAFASGLRQHAGKYASSNVLDSDYARARTVIRGEDEKASLPSVAKESGLGDISAFVATNNKLDTSIKSLDETIKALNTAVNLKTITEPGGDISKAKDNEKVAEKARLDAKAHMAAIAAERKVEFDAMLKGFSDIMTKGYVTSVNGELKMNVDLTGIQGLKAEMKAEILQNIQDSMNKKPTPTPASGS